MAKPRTVHALRQSDIDAQRLDPSVERFSYCGFSENRIEHTWVPYRITCRLCRTHLGMDEHGSFAAKLAAGRAARAEADGTEAPEAPAPAEAPVADKPLQAATVSPSPRLPIKPNIPDRPVGTGYTHTFKPVKGLKVSKRRSRRADRRVGRHWRAATRRDPQGDPVRRVQPLRAEAALRRGLSRADGQRLQRAGAQHDDHRLPGRRGGSGR